MTARKALQHSLNVPAVELLNEVGPPRLPGAPEAGAVPDRHAEGRAPGLAVGLGGLGITLTRSDAPLCGPCPRRRGAGPALAVRTTATCEPASGASPIRWRPGMCATSCAARRRPITRSPAGSPIKTGTSYGYRDAWAVGYDRRFTIGVWVGRPDGTAVPGLVGRLVAAPILFDAYARLGGEPEPVPMPPNTLVATTAGLPPPLRHVRKDVPKTIASTTHAPLKITFPLDGSRVDLGVSNPRGGHGLLALKASGGVPPLTWLVNGAPVGLAELRRNASWRPDGAGFAKVSVIDSRGASDSVSVRLE